MHVQALKWFVTAAAVLALCGGKAHAWIFPEHMELTRFAYERDLPALARENLQAAIRAAMREKLPLCMAIDPLERYVDSGRKCIPYSALPAFAGDHANHAADMTKVLKSTRGLAVLKEVSERWKDFLSDQAPPELQRLYRSRQWRSDSWQPSWENGDIQRVFTRELDIALQAVDSEYTDLAQGSRAHFQDSVMPIGDLLAQLKSRGNMDNALAQVFAHHIRSVQLALAGSREPAVRDRLWTEALMEHALALHFIQDAFAAGHIGTEHGITVDVDKMRRHDFLNRAGLNVQRFALGARCDNVTPGGRNATIVNDPVRSPCWVAFGDAYLDGYNARIIADAVAHLQIQFAMAIGLAGPKSASPADRIKGGWGINAGEQWFRGCSTTAPEGQLSTRPSGIPTMMMPATEETTPDGTGPFVRFEGEGISHVHRCRLVKDASGIACRYVASGAVAPAGAADVPVQGRVRVAVYSEVFDPQIAVRQCTDSGCDHPRKVDAKADISDFDIQASVEFDAELGKVYEFVIGNDGRTPEPRGDAYYWSLTDASAHDVVTTSGCKELIRAAELLDPAPVWSQTEEEKKRRAGWTLAQRWIWARYIVQGALAALDEVGRLDAVACVGKCKKERALMTAGGTSGATVGLGINHAIGEPLEPCGPSPLWQARTHPLCSTTGGVFLFGAPQASLWRPILAIWPTPMGDITVIEGKDAFGKGFAAQVVFGGGPAVQTWDDVAWAASGWLGFGSSFRVNDLFPARENRAVVELNLAVQPMVSMLEDSRFQMAGFFELRFPLIPFIMAVAWGETCPVELGPLGYRYYFQWPNLIPGGEGHWFSGVDVEFLNVAIGGGSRARDREAGHILDLELRLRFGVFREWFLLGPEREAFTPVFSAELAWGHSTYFADL